MIVISISSVPTKLRGFLTKYLWEISTGVYVGDLNSRIRDALWKRIQDNLSVDSKCIMVFSADNEQGFDFLTAGTGRMSMDYEGLKLILNPSEKQPTERPIEFSSLHSAFYEKEYVVLDLETTGLDVESDHILEIGALKVEAGKLQQEFNRIIEVNVPDAITELTGITQEMADKGDQIANALKDLSSFINDKTVIGYNIRMFDAKILKRECIRQGIAFPLRKVVDVMEVIKRKNIGISSYKMNVVADFLGIATQESHRALSDCRVCDKIYRWLLTH